MLQKKLALTNITLLKKNITLFLDALAEMRKLSTVKPA